MVILPPTQKYPYERQWDLASLWAASENFLVKKVKVSKLWEERYASVFCWQQDGEKIDNDFFLHHLKRILEADLSYPIILSEEEYIFDGVHRLMKCKYLNIEYIDCVQFKIDPDAINLPLIWISL